ncbi:MAG: ATP-dependent RecD-like DNA helicase [Fibrobacter sp.]|nr:ATP-dependent RecD-like DNA helicase [Fibrobacter sp.]
MILTGSIKTITFHNPQNGFTVMRLTDAETQKVVVVTGNFPEFSTGESLKLTGDWGRHPKFGPQFVCTGFEILAPEDSSIESYLSSGLFPGIGPKTAANIVAVFGDRTADILDNEPDTFRKTKIKGLTAKKAELFLARWQENRHSRETMLFLYQHDITGSIAKKLWTKYGQDTIRRIKDNPYMLCEDVYGIGFVKADEIATKIGFPKDSPVRLEAAILYTLQESTSDGHVFLPKGALLERTAKNLRLTYEDEDAYNTILEKFEELCGRERIKRVDDDCFYPPIFRAEQNIADNILLRLQGNRLPVEGFESKLVDWEREHRFAFDPIQREAISMAISYKISVITGGPGTGKTTILKGILHLARKMEEKIRLAAPTGRAAKRMSECSGEDACTIHRLLEVDPITGKFNKDVSNQLECDLLVIDEFSMVDTWLAAAILEATPLRTRIVFIGDANQLPSVGPGNVLNDLLQCPQIPNIRLQHIFRQSGGNDIADKAAKINQGITPAPIDGPNFHFIPFETPEQAREIVRQLLASGVRSKINVDLKTEMQLLTPMRKGPLGTFELNTFLQDILNPERTPTRAGVERHRIAGVRWSEGDRVMQVRNNYDKNVFNGDTGIIYRISKNTNKVTVFFEDKTVEYESDEMDQLALAYACTIHKSQGSEYPAVIVVLDSSHYMMLQRNLIYTAITRAKGHVWVLSAPGAFHQAVRNNRSTKRYTRLKERLG